MDENSKQGGEVIESVDLGNTNLEPKHRENSSKELFQKDPARYWYIEGMRDEIELLYEEAATKYTAAYTQAIREGRSSALPYKWEAMRCIEFAAIYKGLMDEWAATKNTGRMIDEHQHMVHWYDEKSVVPKELLDVYKKKVPAGFLYNVVIYNRENKQCRFVHSLDYHKDSDPLMDREYVAYPGGFVQANVYIKDPEVIFHKWMLTSNKLNDTHDFRNAVKRSIRLRYLQMPDSLRQEMHKSSVYKKYVAPAIGNRSVGSLFDDFVAYKAGLV